MLVALARKNANANLRGSSPVVCTGFVSFVTATHVPDVNIDWSNPSNALTDDTSAATYLPASFGTSDFVRFTELNTTIPSTATIIGIAFRFRRFNANTGIAVQDGNIHVYDDGTLGDNKTGSASWASSAETVSFGGSDDLHGLTLTPSDVNGANFGFQLNASSGFGFPDANLASVEFAEMQVCYIPGGEAETARTPQNPMLVHAGRMMTRG